MVDGFVQFLIDIYENLLETFEMLSSDDLYERRESNFKFGVLTVFVQAITFFFISSSFSVLFGLVACYFFGKAEAFREAIRV